MSKQNGNDSFRNRLPVELLERVPEIRSQYSEMEQQYAPGLNEQDTADIRAIEKLHGTEQADLRKPPIYLVFEDLFLPFVYECIESDARGKRSLELLDWLEELANSEDKDIVTLVAATFCESLITNKSSSHLPLVAPYLGETLRKLCVGFFGAFIVDEETRSLLGA